MEFNFSISFEQQPDDMKAYIMQGMVEDNVTDRKQEYCGTSTLTGEEVHRDTQVTYSFDQVIAVSSIEYMNPANDRAAFAMKSVTITITEKR